MGASSFSFRIKEECDEWGIHRVDQWGGAWDHLPIKADSLQSAYQQLYDQAVNRHGQDMYNGTIATTTGVIDKTDVLIRITDEEFKMIKRMNGKCGYDPSRINLGEIRRKWRREAWDNTTKWDVVWGAKIADNDYMLAGWAAE